MCATSMTGGIEEIVKVALTGQADTKLAMKITSSNQTLFSTSLHL
jgi:hypothetical protein